MKKCLIAIILTILLFPLTAFAVEYTSTNLEETLEAEGIEVTYDTDAYEETDDQVIIYLFRGSGCSHCEEFLEFLDSIVDDYGTYFRVVAYETWNDTNNNALLSEVATYFDESSYGVPFIVIGENHYVGYSSSMDDELIEAITSIYYEDEKFDILAELNLDEASTTEDSESSNLGFIVTIIVLIVLIIGIIVYYNSRVKELKEEIDALVKKLNTKEKKTKPIKE